MKAGRVIILIGVGIIVAMVLTVSMWAIPRAAADTSPIASPEGAVSSFWTFTIANILFGLAMLGATFLARGGASTALLVFAGLGAFLFGLWDFDLKESHLWQYMNHYLVHNKRNVEACG